MNNWRKNDKEGGLSVLLLLPPGSRLFRLAAADYFHVFLRTEERWKGHVSPQESELFVIRCQIWEVPAGLGPSSASAAAQWRCETQALLTASSSNRRLNSQTPAVLRSNASAPELLERPHMRKKKKRSKNSSALQRGLTLICQHINSHSWLCCPSTMHLLARCWASFERVPSYHVCCYVCTERRVRYLLLYRRNKSAILAEISLS